MRHLSKVTWTTRKIAAVGDGLSPSAYLHSTKAWSPVLCSVQQRQLLLRLRSQEMAALLNILCQRDGRLGNATVAALTAAQAAERGQDGATIVLTLLRCHLPNNATPLSTCIKTTSRSANQLLAQFCDNKKISRIINKTQQSKHIWKRTAAQISLHFVRFVGLARDVIQPEFHWKDVHTESLSCLVTKLRHCSPKEISRFTTGSWSGRALTPRHSTASSASLLPFRLNFQLPS